MTELRERLYTTVRTCAAEAMDDGMSVLDITALFTRAVEEERDARTAETAKQLYGSADR